MSFYFQRLLFCLGLLLPISGWAQQRCENLFVSEKQILENLARLHIQIENAQNTLIQDVLNKELTKKRQAALNSGLNLSPLNEKIQELRVQDKTDNLEQEKRIQKTKEIEEKNLNSTLILETQGAFGGLRFSADGRIIMATDASANTFLFDTETGKPVKSFKQTNISTNAQWTYGQRKGNDFSTLSFSDLMTGAKGPEFLLESDGFRQYVVTSPDDRLVATGFNESEGPITLWDLQAQKKLGIFETKSTIASMSFSARGDRLVTLNSSGRITVWDTGNFKKVGEQVIKDFINGAPCFINTQGTQVLVLSGGRAVDLWDLTTNQKTLIRGSFWSPHIGRYANIKRLSSQGELSIEIFDFDNPSTPLAILPIGKTVINAIHFSYDGTQLAVSTQDRITQIFKLPKPPEAL